MTWEKTVRCKNVIKVYTFSVGNYIAADAVIVRNIFSVTFKMKEKIRKAYAFNVLIAFFRDFRIHTILIYVSNFIFYRDK